MVQQTLSVSWNLSYLEPFSVTNRVRQSGVLSPLLFTVYLGGVGYADDVALLAPSPSAMHRLLRGGMSRFAINILCHVFSSPVPLGQ